MYHILYSTSPLCNWQKLCPHNIILNLCPFQALVHGLHSAPDITRFHKDSGDVSSWMDKQIRTVVGDVIVPSQPSQLRARLVRYNAVS